MPDESAILRFTVRHDAGYGPRALEVTMRPAAIALQISLLMAGVVPALAAAWEKPVAPSVPSASGYVPIPGAAVVPQKSRVYRAVFDATRAADAARLRRSRSRSTWRRQGRRSSSGWESRWHRPAIARAGAGAPDSGTSRPER
jgi:hypothetical protein